MAFTIRQHPHGLAEPSHTHDLNDPPHGHGDGPHAHTVPGARLEAGLIFNLALGSLCTTSTTLAPMAPTPAFTPAHSGTWVAAGRDRPRRSPSPHRIAIHGAGDQWAHNNMPPFLALFFIIRFE